MATTAPAFFWSIVDWIYGLLTQIILSILAAGPMPKHICFVMDGNRRYARSHAKRVQEGHTQGFYALHRILDVCLQLNIRCVSVYAFAIENFKRPEEEVTALMDLAKTKLIEMTQKGALLDRNGVRVNIIGRREMLPHDVQEVAKQVEDMTRHHTNAILNICMPYASRHEMTDAIDEAIRRCDGSPEDIDEDEIEKHLEMTVRGSPPLDVLIRTSGTYRLSDYMLWQACENTQLHFTSTYWPDFGLRDFVPILLAFQKRVWASPSPSLPSTPSL